MDASDHSSLLELSGHAVQLCSFVARILGFLTRERW